MINEATSATAARERTKLPFGIDLIIFLHTPLTEIILSGLTYFNRLLTDILALFAGRLKSMPSSPMVMGPL
jgi:hypothetical protein